jgi:phenylalanyl-tRNA synthetase beta chain
MRPAIGGVVVGRILALEKHPNADRLQVGQIDVGDGKPLTIVTAATNVAAKQTIGVATIGARLPEMTIEPRKMRGIASEGMMISAGELALPGEWFEDGIMQLDESIALGTNLIEHFRLDLPVLDVEITSNRVDAMSMLGLARELAASYGLPLRLPSFVNPANDDEPAGEAPNVSIESPDCTRFVAQRFDGVRVGTAPAWMRVRLALAGQRPINDLVDVSNYVMLETGQPLHFYDAAKIHGSLHVRDARADERLVTLDGTERTLSPQALVIADDETALGIAGVMGGASSEVTAATAAIVLEAANFNGPRVRRTSMQLGLRSEASSRHEKTLAPALADIGAARAAALLVALGARAYRPHVFGKELVSASAIVLRTPEIARILGLSLSAQRAAQHLEALGCSVRRETEETLSVTPPPWRRDLAIAADIIEEIARMEGYEQIPAAMPPVPAHDISSGEFELESRIAHELAALGYDEVVTYALHGAQFFERGERAGLRRSHESVEVRNPLSEDQRYLRYSIAVPGLIEYFAKAAEPVRVFEIGHVFMRNEQHIDEASELTFGFTSDPVDEPSWRDSGFLRIKGDCERLLHAMTGCRLEISPDTRTGLHPGKTAVLMVDGREVAVLGRVDPRLAAAYELNRPAYLCNIYLDAMPECRSPHYRPPSRFPSTQRDLALVLPLDVAAADLERAVAGTLGALCASVHVFDEYRGSQIPPDRKSLAVRMTLQYYDRTITDEEADAAVALVLAAVGSEFGAVVRA